MRISIVIPCLNAAGTIAAQLEAIASQDWPGGFEVVVADNGSSDATVAVVERLRPKLPDLKLVDASGAPGPARARNLGARAATGEALLFCDDDDVVGEGWLDAMGRALERHEFVACRYDTERLNSPWVRQALAHPQRSGLIRYTYPPFLPHAGGSSLGVRKALHEAVGGFDESLPRLEDTDYCWRLQLAGHRLEFVPDAVVHVRYRSTLRDLFRQARSSGEWNVFIYRRYRDRGMPRLGVATGLASWGKVLLRLPGIATRGGRAAMVWQVGWRVGRLVGSLRQRVFAL